MSTWLTIEEVGNLEGVSARRIRKRLLTENNYTIRRVPGKGGRSGLKTEIDLASLPMEAQARHCLKQAKKPALYIKGKETGKKAELQDINHIEAFNRNEAFRRLQIISGYQDFTANNPRLSDRQARKLYCEIRNQEHPEDTISGQTLWRWMDQAGPSPEKNLSLLASRYGNRAGASLVTAADQALLKAFWYKPMVRMSSAYRKWVKMQPTNRELPSYQTVTRFFKSLPSMESDYYRLTKEAWFNKYGKYTTRLYDTIESSNDIICSDHMQFNFFIAHPKNGKPVRPWLAAWLDMKSRYAVGWVIVLVPNADSIAASLRESIIRYGSPKSVLVDGGADYQSGRFLAGHDKDRRRYKSEKQDLEAAQYAMMLGMLPALDIEIITSEPRKPQGKPNERWHKTLQDDFEPDMPAYCGSDPQNRPDQCQKDIDSGRMLTLDQAHRLFHKWVEETYHNAPHRGNGMNKRTPTEVWIENYTERRRVEPETLDLLMMAREPHVVGQNGIGIHNGHYDAPELDRYRNKKVKGEKIKLVVGSDSKDLRTVVVFDEKGKVLCRAQRDGTTGWGEAINKEALAESRRANKQRKNDIRRGHAADLAMSAAPTFDHVLEEIMETEPQRPTPPAASVVRPVSPDVGPKPLKKAVGAEELLDERRVKPRPEATWDDLIDE